MRKLLTDYSDEPVYNMKAVEQQTGISAATLRAWERRYTLVEPKRTASGYRLYSDRDVALLRWVRMHMEDGLTISRVVAMLESLRSNNDSIWIDSEESSATLYRDAPQPPSALVQPLFQALIDMDDERADEIIEQAFSLYTMPTVYVDIISPTLVEIGEAWHRNEIFVSTEHFASSYLRGRLLSLLQAYPHRPDSPTIFVGCAPTERHEVGALIFAVMLRQVGYNVVYLGQDVPIHDVVQAALASRPAMICMSASTPHAAHLMQDIQAQLSSSEPPAPIFAYGGRAFDLDPHLRESVSGYYLGTDPRDAIQTVNNLLRNAKLNDGY
ncbi:MAG: MerR family transcriptional regulator [Anaerolineae bacterium]|nr:MerR family transcriptional regulator [Anaerolineae bacterium]